MNRDVIKIDSIEDILQPNHKNIKSPKVVRLKVIYTYNNQSNEIYINVADLENKENIDYEEIKNKIVEEINS